MNGVDVALLVLALTIGVTIVGRRLSTPMPVVLAAAGMALGWAWHLVPSLPPVRVPPDRVLLVFLPPLLTSAAYALPLTAVRRNSRSILLLAIGLVLLTMLGAAATAHLALALPWAVALVLGAVVAPPDPVAATAVSTQTGLPHRLTVILEGEGLINDAVAIVAYDLSLRAATTGQFGWGETLLTIGREVPTGILVGLAVGWGMGRLRQSMDDVTLESALSLLAPFVTYELADRLQGSGVLAVVTLGFVLQQRRTDIATPVARLASRTVWGALRFVSTALVFFLLGLLVGEVASAGVDWRSAVGGLAVAAAVVGLRFAWMHSVPRLLRRVGLAPRDTLPSGGELTVLAWAGMRGVVSLALALALPELPLPGGVNGRHVIVLATFVVIVVTLVIQGTTLLPLIHRLGVGDNERDARDEQRVRARAERLALATLARLQREQLIDAQKCRELEQQVRSGAIGIASSGSVSGTRKGTSPAARVLGAQRDVVERARARGSIGESLAERLETEIDVDAMRLRGDSSRLTGEID